MKRIYLLLVFSVLGFHFAVAQGGLWTWISGTNVGNSPAAFGIQGIPGVNNHPPGIYEPCEWKDKQGNFWIYGGSYNQANSDLWKYNPVTNEWTWVKGNGGTNQPPVCGTKGVANSLNMPGMRIYCAATWVDTSGNFWLFGGCSDYAFNYRNDLWKYDLSNNEWTWMNGDSSTNAVGAHGTQGIPGALNTPGARYETCSAWTDSANNLWLFGGQGYDDNGAPGLLNDLCKYNITANEWTWMKGSAFVNAPASYGIRGIANINNDPGGRDSYAKWKDAQGNFWLMGGDAAARLNDVWKYSSGLNEWSWMGGTQVNDDAGNYKSTCVFDTVNLPYSRMEQRSSVTDNCGRFWMFGGWASAGWFNDLWVLDPQQVKWNWINGTNVANQTGNYGSMGVPSPVNMPPSRFGAAAWWGNDNRFYMFGGYGNYCDVWVFNPDTACIPVCGVAVVPPVANFQSNKTTLCANDCINFTDLSTNATTWQWSFAGGSPSTSSGQNPQICYLTSGIYNVTLIASNTGGADTLSINNYITVNAAPAAPGITQVHNDTLVCSADTSYKSYQWYLDSAIVPGATGSFLVISKSGNYNIEITGNNGCKISAGINVVLGLQNYMNDHAVSLWPNPAGDWFTVYGLRFTVASVEIYNVPGQVCQQSQILNLKSQIEVDVSDIPSGIYFVQLIGEKERWVGRFVKE